MPEINGTDVLLLVNTNTPASPTWEVVAAQRDVTFDENTDYLDTSSKDQRERKGLAGRYSWSANLDALFVPGNAQYLALKTAMRGGALLEIRRRESGVDVEKSGGVVANLSSSFPDQGPAVVSATIEGTEAWVAV